MKDKSGVPELCTTCGSKKVVLHMQNMDLRLPQKLCYPCTGKPVPESTVEPLYCEIGNHMTEDWRLPMWKTDRGQSCSWCRVEVGKGLIY